MVCQEVWFSLNFRAIGAGYAANIRHQSNSKVAYPGVAASPPSTAAPEAPLRTHYSQQPEYSYDANGNLLSGGNRSYVWNVDNKPVSVTTLLDNVTETYGYDADGARVAKGRNGVTTYYVGGSWEEDSNGVRKEYILFGTSTIAVKQRDAGGVVTTTYLHGDQLGSVSLATDSSGQVASQQEFDAWGKVRLGGISQTSMNYTGQRLDGTGLLFYNARYYDPQVGKFISSDTIVPSPANPQAFNRYGYAYNNPLKYTDATGHRPDDNQDASDYYPEDSNEVSPDVIKWIKKAGRDFASEVKAKYDWITKDTLARVSVAISKTTGERLSEGTNEIIGGGVDLNDKDTSDLVKNNTTRGACSEAACIDGLPDYATPENTIMTTIDPANGKIVDPWTACQELYKNTGIDFVGKGGLNTIAKGANALGMVAMAYEAR